MGQTEQFANGITIIGLYLNPLPGANAPPIEHSIFQVMKEASLLYCLPDNPFFYASAGAAEGTHAVQEAVYACAWFSSLVSPPPVLRRGLFPAHHAPFLCYP